MAETDLHRDVMFYLINVLDRRYAQEANIYVSGNLLVFYEPGNKRKHISPDVWLARGVPKHRRDNYLIWEEGKAPEFVIEVTSSTTRKEDLTTKRTLYQDVLKVAEYFLFDPRGDYLEPQLQGYRLTKGRYTPIRATKGRLPSKVAGVHLEVDGDQLRLYDPAAAAWLLSDQDAAVRAEAARDQAQAARDAAQAARDAAHAAQAEEATARRAAEAEVARLRQELEALRRRSS
jgi:Uma2 family endonuclease